VYLEARTGRSFLIEAKPDGKNNGDQAYSDLASFSIMGDHLTIAALSVVLRGLRAGGPRLCRHYAV